MSYCTHVEFCNRVTEIQSEYTTFTSEEVRSTEVIVPYTFAENVAYTTTVSQTTSTCSSSGWGS